VMYGSSRSTYSRTRKVGTGSKVYDLIGDDIMIRRTSVIEHSRNDDNEDDAESNTGGAGYRLALPRSSCGP